MKIETTQIVKQTIRTTRRELWTNFMKEITEIARDFETDWVCKEIKCMHSALVVGKPDVVALRKLFADAWTIAMLGEAFDVFDQPTVYRQVIVEENGSEYIIDHECINF